MAGGCGRGVQLSGVAAGRGWPHRRRGRRELRREPSDSTGAAAHGGEIAGAAFGQYGSRWARVSEQVGKNAGAAFGGEGRWRSSRTDGMAVQSFDESRKQVRGISEWRAWSGDFCRAQGIAGHDCGLVRADAGENARKRAREYGPARGSSRDTQTD